MKNVFKTLCVCCAMVLFLTQLNVPSAKHLSAKNALDLEDKLQEDSIALRNVDLHHTLINYLRWKNISTTIFYLLVQMMNVKNKFKEKIISLIWKRNAKFLDIKPLKCHKWKEFQMIPQKNNSHTSCSWLVILICFTKKLTKKSTQK